MCTRRVVSGVKHGTLAVVAACWGHKGPALVSYQGWSRAEAGVARLPDSWLPAPSRRPTSGGHRFCPSSLDLGAGRRWPRGPASARTLPRELRTVLEGILYTACGSLWDQLLPHPALPAPRGHLHHTVCTDRLSASSSGRTKLIHIFAIYTMPFHSFYAAWCFLENI